MRFSFLSALCVIASMIFLSGCAATNWAARDYGKICGAFVATGPAYGDTTQIYVQGELNIYQGGLPPQSHWLRSSEFMTRNLKHYAPEELGTPWRPSKEEPPPLETRPAYMSIKLQKAQTLSTMPAWTLLVDKEIHEGSLPPAAFEYPKITPATRPEKTPYKDVFMASGQDIGTTGWWYLYVKNQNDVNDPFIVWLTGETKQYPRSTTSKIPYPVVVTGAVAVDILATPLYVAKDLGILLLLLLWAISP